MDGQAGEASPGTAPGGEEPDIAAEREQRRIEEGMANILSYGMGGAYRKEGRQDVKEEVNAAQVWREYEKMLDYNAGIQLDDNVRGERELLCRKAVGRAWSPTGCPRRFSTS